MLRSIFSQDWKESPAHLLLLSKFRNPHSIDDYSKRDEWKDVLNEEPSKAIKRMINDGYIVKGDLAYTLSYKYKVSELKILLGDSGLIKSGRKYELVTRLIDADKSGMRKMVKGIDVYICSDLGQELAEEYLAREKTNRQRTEKLVLSALFKHDFRKASKLVANFEANQVFPRGMGIEWNNYDTSQDVIVLKNIFTRKPKALANMDDEDLEPIRVAAGMFQLMWNKGQVANWLLENSKTDLDFEPDRFADMLFSYAKFNEVIQDCRKSGYKYVEIYTCNDNLVCDSCKKISGKKHKLSEVPELPFDHCTSAEGCRCWASPSFLRC